MKYGIAVYSVLTFLFSTLPQAHAGTVTSHAPIGVMGDHTHNKGEWMTSYSYMQMDMPKNYTGSKELTVNQVHDDFVISPINMVMEMHMLGVMYGVNDTITAMAMVPWNKKQMNHRRRTDGRQFQTRTEGLGDIKLSALFRVDELGEQPIHLNMGINLPTGSIDETDETLLGPARNLPYPMQNGSGTYGLLPALTYADTYNNWSWGLQQSNSLYFGRNSRKYRLGNFHELTAWGSYIWTEWASTSLRIKSSLWGDVRGADQRINPAMVPTAAADLRGGERIDLFIGFNLLGTKGKLQEHRLALELGYPVYQHLDGPQLGAGFQGIVGWQLAF